MVRAVTAGLLLATDHPDRGNLLEPGNPPTPAVVRRVQEMLEAAPEEAWTISDLARAAGVSVLSLQDGFARHLGTSPMAHLKQVRLQRAHDDLLLSHPAASSVGTVAARWGFAHTGRFAAQYRSRFGVPPSWTLARD